MNNLFIAAVKQRLVTIGVRQRAIEEWLARWKVFFILAFGRSGTAFMADLLNRAPGAYVFHEPVIEDFYAHMKVHFNPNGASKYIQGFRKKEIYTRMRHISSGVYGEVNSVLRCHADALKETFPGVTLIHLVRDGRDVVRSSMPRRMMTWKDPFSLVLHPGASDPWKTRWDKMDRFARICWYWQEENKRSRMMIGKTVQFEKILSNYDYFLSEILEPCGVHLSKKDWEAAIGNPRNTTVEFSMPKWEMWTAEQQRIFREICGNEMAECGYAF